MMIIDGLPLILKPGGTKFYLESFLSAYSDNLQSYKTSKKYKILIPRFNLGKSSFDFSYVDHLSENHLSLQLNFQFVNINSSFLKLILFLGIKESQLHRYIVFLWEYYYFPKIIKQLKPKIIFHPYQTVSNYQTEAKKIVVIHDIFHWKYQERYTTIEKYFYNGFKTGCENANTVITISETSKKEILSCLNISKDKIKVCYEGFNQLFENFHPKTEKINQLKEKYVLPHKYILGFSSNRDYKNTLGTVKVFHQIVNRPELSNIKLVLIGQSIKSNPQVEKYITSNNMTDKIKVINQFSEIEDLCYLYHLAELFLFLSYEEGFGLPPLESLACNTLPIVSNISSPGELFHQDLPNFPPKDFDHIAQYVIEILTNPKEKEKLIYKARQKLLPRYSWKNILPLYIQVIDS